MNIAGVIITKDVEDKIGSKHLVVVQEVLELLHGRPHIVFREKGMKVKGEDVYTALGQTSAGRYLIVFFIYKFAREALVITARDMSQGERKYYAKVKR